MDWLGIDWHAWEALATSALLIAGLWQVLGIRKEAKKERTLGVCNRYQFDPVLDASARALRKAKYDGSYKTHPKNYRTDIVTLLNYLDGVAIGIAQGLYIESLARDHLEHIVREHCDDYLTHPATQAIDILFSDYAHLDGLRKSWTGQKPYYKDGWRRWK